MFHDHQHPDVSPSHWEAFRKEVSPYVIETVLDRREVNVPAWFVPLARGTAIPSAHLLYLSGYRPGAYRKRGWRKPHCDVLYKDVGRDNLVVRGYRGQPLWWIERNGSPGRPHDHPNRTLVHTFGSTPIVTREYRAATYLAEFCFFNDPPAGLRWVDECPDDLSGAIEFAQNRRIQEILAPVNAGPIVRPRA